MNRAWLGIGIIALLALLLVVFAFTQGDDPPATTTTLVAAPTSTAPPTTTTAPTTTVPTTTPAPTTTVPTTTPAPTTTHDLTAREAEVEALVKELEFALWDADYRRDTEALRDLIGGQALWDRWMGVEDPLSYYATEPAPDTFGLTLNEILLDREDCIVAHVTEGPTRFLNDHGVVEDLTIVMWAVERSSRGWQLADRLLGTTEDHWRGLCDAVDRPT